MQMSTLSIGRTFAKYLVALEARRAEASSGRMK